MNSKLSHMTRSIWPYSEAQAHWDEIMRLAASGEPQHISRPDGVTLVIQMQPAEPEPFVSALAAFEGMPRDGEFILERPKDTPRDIEL